MPKAPWVQRGLWWLARRIFTVHRIGDLDFLDLRPDRGRDTKQLQSVLRDALDRIVAAKGGYGELVTSHLRFVAAMDISDDRVMPAVRGYVYPFKGEDRNNAHGLACRLIWVATGIRLARDAAAQDRELNEAAVRRACHEAQVRFVKQFPDSEEWEAYLDRVFAT
jgi:hypothetical protein